MTLLTAVMRPPAGDGQRGVGPGLRASGRRIVGCTIAALGAANLRIPGRPATVCPLRALTGIPCPFCGGTTAAVHLGRLDLLGALRVNPVVVIGAFAIIAMPALIAIRATRHVVSPPAVARRTIAVGVALVVVCSEVWQLFRFGII